jgi:hypothetical protein
MRDLIAPKFGIRIYEKVPEVAELLHSITYVAESRAPAVDALIAELQRISPYRRRPSISFYTPHQFSQITTLDPFLFSSAAHSEPTSCAAATDTPAVTDFANHSCRAPTNYRARRNDHIGWYHCIGQYLDVFLDDGELIDCDLFSNVYVRRY